jgi:hypothetical protein
MGTHAMPSAAAHGGPDGEGAQPSTNRPLTRAALSVARVAYKEEMWRNRMALIAAAHEQKATNVTAPTADEQRATNAATPTADQGQALQAFVAVAARLSAALAADDLATANQCVTNLPSVLLPLQKAIGADHPGSGPIQRLVSLQWRPSQNLATAREQFLPFSTATVELVKGLRKEDPAFAGLKIYHCPMAPKPGLWMQSKGPLANPFYGAKMLTCGEEVKP